MTAILRSARPLVPWLKGMVPVAAGLLLWQLLPAAQDSPFFPPPSDWARALSNQYDLGAILSALGATLRTVLLGLLTATVIGSVLGIAIGSFQVVRLSLSTTIEFLRALPSPVIVPIAILAFGVGEQLKVFVVAFAAVWPVLLNAASAAGATSPLLLEVARTLHLSRAQQIRKIVVPSTVPAILLGVRVALPVAVVLTILVEMLVSTGGIGSLLIEAQRAYRSADAFGLLFIVGLFGYALNALFTRLGWFFLRRWPEADTAG